MLTDILVFCLYLAIAFKLISLLHRVYQLRPAANEAVQSDLNYFKERIVQVIESARFIEQRSGECDFKVAIATEINLDAIMAGDAEEIWKAILATNSFGDALGDIYTYAECVKKPISNDIETLERILLKSL